MKSDQKKALALLAIFTAESIFFYSILRKAEDEIIRLKTELIIKEIERAHLAYKTKKKGFFK